MFFYGLRYLIRYAIALLRLPLILSRPALHLLDDLEHTRYEVLRDGLGGPYMRRQIERRHAYHVASLSISEGEYRVNERGTTGRRRVQDYLQVGEVHVYLRGHLAVAHALEELVDDDKVRAALQVRAVLLVDVLDGYAQPRAGPVPKVVC